MIFRTKKATMNLFEHFPSRHAMQSETMELPYRNLQQNHLLYIIHRLYIYIYIILSYIYVFISVYIYYSVLFPFVKKLFFSMLFPVFSKFIAFARNAIKYPQLLYLSFAALITLHFVLCGKLSKCSPFKSNSGEQLAFCELKAANYSTTQRPDTPEYCIRIRANPDVRDSKRMSKGTGRFIPGS
jgi:hypothetical protein